MPQAIDTIHFDFLNITDVGYWGNDTTLPSSLSNKIRAGNYYSLRSPFISLSVKPLTSCMQMANGEKENANEIDLIQTGNKEDIPWG